MANTKKKKGLYSRKLKDISGDGKRNLADTYLGDLIGLDGKVGIGKKNPGIKDSLKGARREDGTTKKTAAKKTTVKKKPAPAKNDSGPDKRGKRPPALTKVKPTAGPKTRRKPTSPVPGPKDRVKKPVLTKVKPTAGPEKRHKGPKRTPNEQKLLDWKNGTNKNLTMRQRFRLYKWARRNGKSVPRDLYPSGQ